MDNGSNFEKSGHLACEEVSRMTIGEDTISIFICDNHVAVQEAGNCESKSEHVHRLFTSVEVVPASWASRNTFAPIAGIKVALELSN